MSDEQLRIGFDEFGRELQSFTEGELHENSWQRVFPQALEFELPGLCMNADQSKFAVRHLHEIFLL